MYVVGREIRVEYQPTGASAGLTIKMEILDETGYTDTVNYPVSTLTELPLSGGSIYRGVFTPDTAGAWTVRVYVEGQVESTIKQYEVISAAIEDKLGAPPTIA